MVINFKKTDLYYAIKYSWLFDFANLLKKISLFCLIAIGLIYLFLETDLNLKGAFFIVLSIFLICFVLADFFNSGLKENRVKKDINEVLKNPDNYNLAEFFNYDAAKIIYNSIKYAKKKKIQKLDSSILLYFSIKNSSKLNFIFSRILLNPETVQKILKQEIKESKKGKFDGFTKNFEKAVLMALELNKNRKNCKIRAGDLMAGLAEHSYTLKTIIIAKNIKPQDIKVLSFWLDDTIEKRNKLRKWWKYENLLKYGSLARDWAIPYSLSLDEYSRNLINIKNKNILLNKIIARDQEVSAIERILQKSEKNNILLVADTGVGKMKIVKEIARKAFLGISLPDINYKKIVLLDLQFIISKSESNKKVTLILNQIFTEVVNSGNIILVIEDIHNYIGQKERPGIIDITGILNKFLSFENFRLIGITSFAGYRQFIYPNESFLSYFEKVEVLDLSKKDTMKVLANLAFSLEYKHKIFITYLTIKNVVDYSDKYLKQEPFPGKAINLLNDVIHYALYIKKDQVIRKKYVEEVIYEKTKILVGEADIEETKTLLNLEEIIGKRLIGQKEAIKSVSSSLRRTRAEITIKGGPIGGFLFLGPTGVGKTELAKVLAKTYFGAEENIIRLDMSEYQSTADIYRLIGSTTQQGYLTMKVLERPFSLVLLDEIEKAHPDILNLFLQILDEGYITDGVGKKINFKNTIIIATSNAGAKLILDCADQEVEEEKLKEKLLNYIFENAIFRPEFINRFDAVVLFNALSKKNLLMIADLLLKKFKKNLKEKKSIEFKITNTLKEKITELSYKPEYGAREMKRVIQDNIEDKVAIIILEKQIKSGDKISIDPETFRVEKNL